MKSLSNKIYLQVIVALVLGAAFGEFAPGLGSDLKFLGDLFVKLIRVLIAPIIFLTIAVGFARMSDLKKVGKVGMIAVIYFEVITTFALILGLLAGNLLQPGAGMHIRPESLDASVAQSYVKSAHGLGFQEQILGIVPNTWMSAFVGGEGIQVLFIALIFGLGMTLARPRPEALAHVFEEASRVMFVIVGFVMRFAPVAAFGAMAFTVGKYGLHSLLPLVLMVVTTYATSIVFVVVVLGTVCRLIGVPLGRLLAYTKEEILITLGTCSSEAVMPQIFRKLEALGCSKSSVGLVLPAGFAFNLDGTCIYLTLAVVFLAQAMDLTLSFADQLGIILVLMVMTKGVAGVAGIGFVTLAAALSAQDSKIPVAGLAILVGVDRFMQESRAVVSLIGNIVGTVVIAVLAGEADVAVLRERLRNPPPTADLLASTPAGGEPAVSAPSGGPAAAAGAR
jgi:aerobic C4-dicarboxylate transport protein